MVKKGDMMDIEDMIEILAIELLGVVPEDEKIVISTNKGEPVISDPASKAGQAFRNISRRLEGEDVPLMNFEVENSFMERLKIFFGLKR